MICSEQKYSACGGVQHPDCQIYEGVFIYEISSGSGIKTRISSKRNDFKQGDCVQIVYDSLGDEINFFGKIIRKTNNPRKQQEINSDYAIEIFNKPDKSVNLFPSKSCP